MYQPLVAIDDWLLITPSLLLNGVPERNLIALIQQKNTDRKHFNEVNRLEGLMRQQIEESIYHCKSKNIILCHDVDIKRGNDLETNLDFGIYDVSTNSVLLSEMKWLLAADASVEVYARESEVDHGCDQIDKAMTYAMTNRVEFMKRAFGIDALDEQIEFFCCVVTKADVRGNSRNVPVISQRKLEQLICSGKRFRDIFETIRRKDYYEPLRDGVVYEDYVFEYAGFRFHVPAMMIPDEANRV